MKIVIDDGLCTGHGLCYAAAPMLLGPDERGYGIVLQAELDAAGIERARRAVASCPEQAVSIVDD